MQVKDVMTQKVISVRENDSVVAAARLMLLNRISGLPVLNNEGALVGIITEGDFLRRSEIETQRRRPRWLEFVIGPGRLADEYVHTSGRKVGEIMTPNPQFVTENEALEAVVERMEHHHIKRLPVMRDGRMVGIISRANLVQALASLARDSEGPAGADTPGPDSVIRGEILAVLDKQHWVPNIDVVVRNGVVELWGVINDYRERQALVIATENVTGVKQVHDHLVWVEPMSGMAFPSAEDKAKERAAAS